MSLRANIRNHIRFPHVSAPLKPVFDTVFPLELQVTGRDGGIEVSLFDTSSVHCDEDPAKELGSAWVTTWVKETDTDEQLQASIREKAAILIERSRYYA